MTQVVDLGSLAQAAAARRMVVQQQAVAAMAAAVKQREAEASALLRAFVGDEAYETMVSLGLKIVEWDRRPSAAELPTALVDVKVMVAKEHRVDGKQQWRCWFYGSNLPHGWRDTYQAIYETAQDLFDQVVLSLARAEKQVAENAEAKARQERLLAQEHKRIRIEREQAEAEREQAEAERAERELTARAMHDRLAGFVKAELDKQAAALWRWPAGTSLVVYKVRWQRGAAVDNDGCVEFDYHETWTFQDRLDANNALWCQERGHLVQKVLIPEAHRPEFTRCEFEVMADLPCGLYEIVSGTVPGVDQRWNVDAREDLYTEGDDFTTWGVIGRVPVSWLRGEIDRLAGREVANG